MARVKSSTEVLAPELAHSAFSMAFDGTDGHAHRFRNERPATHLLNKRVSRVKSAGIGRILRDDVERSYTHSFSPKIRLRLKALP
jgi:hypothetical protein